MNANGTVENDAPPDTVRRAADAGYQIQMTCRHCGRVECADLLSMLAADQGNLSVWSMCGFYCADCSKRGQTIALIKS